MKFHCQSVWNVVICLWNYSNSCVPRPQVATGPRLCYVSTFAGLFFVQFFFLASSTMINDYTYISHLFWFPPNFEKWKTPQPIPFCSPHLLVQPCPCCQNKNKKKIPRVRVRFLKDKKWDWTEENNSLSRNSHFNCFFFLTRENNYGTTFSAKKFLKSVKYID